VRPARDCSQPAAARECIAHCRVSHTSWARRKELERAVCTLIKCPQPRISCPRPMRAVLFIFNVHFHTSACCLFALHPGVSEMVGHFIAGDVILIHHTLALCTSWQPPRRVYGLCCAVILNYPGDFIEKWIYARRSPCLWSSRELYLHGVQLSFTLRMPSTY
jgi:hypothetical protein